MREVAAGALAGSEPDDGELPPPPPAAVLAAGAGGRATTARPEPGVDPSLPPAPPSALVAAAGEDLELGAPSAPRFDPVVVGSSTHGIELPARSTEESADFAAGALFLTGPLVPIPGSTISLPPFAHLDASEEPAGAAALGGPAGETGEDRRTGEAGGSGSDDARASVPERPRQRPSVAAAPLRLPADPIPLTPLFGKDRDEVTAATVGFDFAPAAMPTGRRPASPWLSRPLLDLVPAGAEQPGNRQSKAMIALVGLAATVLPSLGLVAIARGASDPTVASASVASGASATSVAERPTVASTVAEPATTAESTTTSEPEPPATTAAPLITEPVMTAAVAPPPPPPPATPPTTQARSTTTPSPMVYEAGSVPGATAAEQQFLACTRRIESTNNYRAVDPSGTYFGAYQFEQRTWNGVAARQGRNDLVGVRPSSASPADQDAMALALFRERGSQPWGGRCA